MLRKGACCARQKIDNTEALQLDFASLLEPNPIIALFAVPRCFTTPTIIPNTVQNLISEKVTVYQCSEGYTGHMDNITVICSSPDEDKIPWNWEDSEVEAKLNCFPSECISISITHQHLQYHEIKKCFCFGSKYYLNEYGNNQTYLDL